MSATTTPTNGHINSIVITNTIGLTETIYADNADLLYFGPWCPVQGSGASSSASTLGNTSIVEMWVGTPGTESLIEANFNTSNCGAGQYPDAILEIDGVQGARTTLTSAGLLVGVFPTIAGTDTNTFVGHRVRLIMANVPDGSGNGWTSTPPSIWSFTGFTIDASATLLPTYAQKPTIAFFGDSISYGENELQGGSIPAGQCSTLSFPYLVCDMLGFEAKNYSYSGNGIVKSGLGTGYNQFGVPIFPNSFGYAASGVAYKAMSPVFTVFELGTNDHGQSVSPSSYQTAYEAALAQVLTAYPNTIIIPMLMPNMVQSSPVASYATAVNNAITALASPQCPLSNLLDVSTLLVSGTTTDGTHPNPTGHLLIAQALAAKIEALITSYNLKVYAPAGGAGGGNAGLTGGISG
jgi:hypothetical protein